jgi:flagellin-specific chaperone FliS
MDAEKLEQAITELYPTAKLYHETKAVRMQHPQSIKLAVIHKELWNETLNISCGSCVCKALNRLYQFQYLRMKVKRPETKVEQKLNEVKDFAQGNDLPKTLGELRKLYPHIKAVSYKGFVEKIKAEDGTR